MGRPKVTPQKRAQHRKQLTETFWAQKKAAATTPQQRCMVAFDRLRAEFADIPERQRDSAWTQLAGYLEAIVEQVTKR